jgi:hypothetical protein
MPAPVVLLGLGLLAAVGSCRAGELDPPVTGCGRYATCGECAPPVLSRGTGCAWCLQSERCVDDTGGVCDGPDDHVGRRGAGVCPGTSADVAAMLDSHRAELNKRKTERLEVRHI